MYRGDHGRHHLTDWANDGVFGDGWHLAGYSAGARMGSRAGTVTQTAYRDAWLAAAEEGNGVDVRPLPSSWRPRPDADVLAGATAALAADPLPQPIS